MVTIPPICTKCINFSLLFLQNVYISPYIHKIDQFIPPISAQFIHFPLFPRNLLTYMHATEKNTCMPTYMFRAYVLQYLHSLPEYIHVHTWIHSITHMHASKHTPIHTSTLKKTLCVLDFDSDINALQSLKTKNAENTTKFNGPPFRKTNLYCHFFGLS